MQKKFIVCFKNVRYGYTRFEFAFATLDEAQEFARKAIEGVVPDEDGFEVAIQYEEVVRKEDK